MKNIVSLTKKELRDYFISPIAYIVLLAFSVISSVVFFKDLFVVNQATMRPLFEFIPLLLVVIIPALTMRSYAEEKQGGTLEMLATMPISAMQLVLAKFFSTLLFVLLMLATTLPFVITINILGNPDNGIIFTSYFGLLLLSSAYIAVGQLISINTNNQIVAFIVSVILIGIVYLFGEDIFLEQVSSSAQGLFQALGIGAHFKSIAKGVVDSRDVLYYLTIILVVFSFIYASLLRIKRTGK